jgi:hypothetical protein
VSLVLLAVVAAVARALLAERPLRIRVERVALVWLLPLQAHLQLMRVAVAVMETRLVVLLVLAVARLVLLLLVRREMRLQTRAVAVVALTTQRLALAVAVSSLFGMRLRESYVYQ